MNLERYEYIISNSFLEYYFESIGPNGIIKKKISFVLTNTTGITYFNLVFGDTDDSGTINDLAVSDNKDSEKILATIAIAVLDFLEHLPDMVVYAVGSTPARTRLYQMGIARYWNEISSLLQVYGLSNDGWELFTKNSNYKAFFVSRRK